MTVVGQIRIAACLTLVCGGIQRVAAQDAQSPLQLAYREPRFFSSVGSRGERVDAREAAVLKRRISVSLDGATIAQALELIGARGGLSIVYGKDMLPAEGKVTLKAEDITVAGALMQVLLDADLDVELESDQLASLVRRSTAAVIKRVQQTGSVGGRVTDAKTGQAIPYATVLLEGTKYGTTASDSGTYRIASVPAGTYTVIGRILGYIAGRKSVTVVGDQTASIDFVLQKSPNQLQQVVTTGTVTPTEVKAIPTPITVISDSEIAQQQPRTINDIFRQYVPTGVSFDYFAYPNLTYLSVRGATDLGQGGTQVKTIIDGVDVAANNLSPIDPASIDHIEVIRGPEAAAIYGSGAIDGVLEIFTKHGEASNGRPSIDAQVSAGDVQTPYPGFRGVLRQTYSADVRGGTDDASYAIGGGYTETNNYLPFGALSAQSTPSVHGGIHYGKGITTLDVSARYQVVNAPSVNNPALATSEPPGNSYYVPSYMSEASTNATVGATLGVKPLPWWRNVLSIGYDEFNSSLVQRRSHLTTPSDTLLAYDYSNASKISLRANSSVTRQMSSDVSGTLTVGADYWSTTSLSAASFGLFNTTGALATDPSSPFSVTRFPAFNTGVFAQAQVGVWDALFLTAGVRADWGPDFGDSISTPISPRVGIAYSHSLGFATLKLRSSWGSAILPPGPGDKEFQIGSFNIQLANPHLVPERQYGGDAGFDLLFGQVGSFSATGFDQRAVNLIQQVQLPSDTLQTLQNQNVGTVTNLGVELEGGLHIGRFAVRVMYGYTRSRIDKLGPNYTGDYEIGDQVFDVPRHTGGGSVSVRLWRGTNLSAGLTYVGPWTDYDNITLNACFAGASGACPAAYLANPNTFRAFLIQYPSLVKGTVSLTQPLSRWASAFVSIENIGDDQGYEANNQTPRVGRISTAGLRLHY